MGSNFLCNFVAKINDINKMIKTMKHRDYMKPTMRVVMLRHAGMLMTSNKDGQAGVQNYNWTDVEEE